MVKAWNFFRALYIWLVGGGIFFVATILGIIFFNVMPAKNIHYPFSRLLRLIFVFTFIPVKRNMNFKLNKNQSYIFMANHTSLIDVPLMGAYLPVFANALEAHTHFKWPVYKHLIKAYGQIPVDRSSPQKSLHSFNLAAQKVNSGTSIIVFPEGHRTRDGQMRPFKRLPFMMSKKTNATIVPIGVKGMWKVCGGETFFLRNAKLTLNFGNPIPPEQITQMSEEELIHHVQNEIKNLID